MHLNELVEKFLIPISTGNNKKLYSEFLDKIIPYKYIFGCFREDLPKYSISFCSKRPDYSKAKSNRSKELFIVIALNNSKFQIMDDDIFEKLLREQYEYYGYKFGRFYNHIIVGLEDYGYSPKPPIQWYIISENDNPIDIIINKDLSLDSALRYFHEGETIFRKKWKEEGNDKELKDGPENDFLFTLEDIETKDWCVKTQITQKINIPKPKLVDFIQASKYLEDGKKIYSNALDEYGIKYLKIIESIVTKKVDDDAGHAERDIGAYVHGEIYKWNEQEFFEKHSLTDKIWYTEN